MKKTMFQVALAASILSLAPLASYCGGSDDADSAQHVTVKSALPRAAAAAPDSAEVKAVARAQREFSADLFKQLSGQFA